MSTERDDYPLNTPSEPLSRRQLLGHASKIAAGAGISLVAAAPRSARAVPASEKVVLAIIGAGGRGSQVIESFGTRKDVEVAYICDVDDSRATSLSATLAKNQAKPPARVTDMRRVFDDKAVDGVVIATPEHWHALAAIWACQAGKDVYVEKNCSLSIWEGRKMIEAARKYDRVVQVGTQNRSAPYNMAARDFIKSGKLGKVYFVKVYNMLPSGRWTPQPDSAAPAGLDWDRWLGPAPARPYSVARNRGWYDYWEYCGGTLSGDGSHQLDLTRMVLSDKAWPKSIHCTGGRYQYDDHRDMPDTQVITYEYDDMVMTMESTTITTYMDKIAPDVRAGDLFPYWPQCSTRIEIYGTDAIMYLGRHGGGWQVFGKAKTQSRPGELIAQAYGRFPDLPHQENFVECIRSRKRPNADIEEAHKGACLVHFGNVAYRTGNRKLNFNAQTETFGDREADALLKPAYRKGYAVPEKV